MYRRKLKKGVHVFTDGACRGNPGPGSWAMAVYEEHKYIGCKKGFLPETTNNIAELTAFLKVLDWTTRIKGHVHIYVDSTYVMDGYDKWLGNWVRRGWKTASGTPVKNADLWKKIYALKQKVDLRIDIHKVKGHSGNEGNTKADALCNEVLDEELNN